MEILCTISFLYLRFLQKEKDLRYFLKSFLVAGAGFEPTTFGL